MKTLAVLLLATLAWPLSVSAAGTEEKFSVEPFGPLTLYHPTAPATPAAAGSPLVLFVSGDGGWKLGVVDMARELAAMGAVVVGIDITRYIKTVVGAAATRPDSCFDPGKDFADLGRTVEERLGGGAGSGRRAPILVGYSSGATLVYAALVQAPPHTFGGALSLGFCPDLIVNMPICKGNGLTWETDLHHKGVDFLPSNLLAVPWIAMQGDIDKICTPEDTRTYVQKVPHGQLVWLHKVGHGFSVPKNWMPQFKESFARIAHTADGARTGE
jgi:type IV secretory pathway VirJ component